MQEIYYILGTFHMDKKILIVEDNKTLAKLIAKKIQTTLGIKADVAYTLTEAKLFIARYQYFIALLDINLPDAQMEKSLII